MVFVRGMYCALREPVREMRRMREFRAEEGLVVGLGLLVVVVVVGGFLEVEREEERRLWWVRAKVRAPERAMEGDGVVGGGGEWVVRRAVREARRVCWRERKGR